MGFPTSKNWAETAAACGKRGAIPAAGLFSAWQLSCPGGSDRKGEREKHSFDSARNNFVLYFGAKISAGAQVCLHRKEEIYYDRCNEALYLRQSGMRKQSQTLC